MILDDSNKTGGPAFPSMEIRTEDTQDIVHGASQGMTLRDHFAAKALPSIMQNSGGHLADLHLDRYATIAYRMADAMLKVRAV